MCLREYDEKRTMELFEKEWKEEGRQEGLKEEKKLRSLMDKLISEEKFDDARRVLKDDEFREKLCREYSITGASE